MPAAAADDVVRERVEAVLRQAVDDLLALPCGLAGRVRRGVAQPFALAGSLVTLTLEGLLGRGLDGAPPDSATPSALPPAAQPAAGDGTAMAPDAGTLPIEEYESLAASQVVARLERLDADELRQIEQFETAHRGRRTVLGKIEQLAAGR